MNDKYIYKKGGPQPRSHLRDGLRTDGPTSATNAYLALKAGQQ